MKRVIPIATEFGTIEIELLGYSSLTKFAKFSIEFDNGLTDKVKIKTTMTMLNSIINACKDIINKQEK